MEEKGRKENEGVIAMGKRQHGWLHLITKEMEDGGKVTFARPLHWRKIENNGAFVNFFVKDNRDNTLQHYKKKHYYLDQNLYIRSKIRR